MNNLLVYETFTRGNIDKNELVKIKIYSSKNINDIVIKQINNMSFDDVQKLAKINKWKIFRING